MARPIESYYTYYDNHLLSLSYHRCRYSYREDSMNTIGRLGGRFLHTVRKLILILVLIAIVVISILSTLGVRTSRVFDQVNCTLAGGSYHQDNGNGNSNRCR
jgi:hypothetical protein